jgi:hypothetical protein
MSALMSETTSDTLTPGPTLAVSTVEARLEELRAEHANGCRQLSRLDAQREELAATLDRIDGAITVLRELLGPTPPTRTPRVAP